MIWSFVGGFVFGAVLCFVSLVVVACFSLKNKQSKFEQVLNGAVKLTPDDVKVLNQIEKEIKNVSKESN